MAVFFWVCSVCAGRGDVTSYSLEELEKAPASHHSELVRVKGFWVFDWESCGIADRADASAVCLPLILKNEELKKLS